jgi:hypothetical protein
MLFDPDMTYIREITGGDVPLGAKGRGVGKSGVVAV